MKGWVPDDGHFWLGEPYLALLAILSIPMPITLDR